MNSCLLSLPRGFKKNPFEEYFKNSFKVWKFLDLTLRSAYLQELDSWASAESQSQTAEVMWHSYFPKGPPIFKMKLKTYFLKMSIPSFKYQIMGINVYPYNKFYVPGTQICNTKLYFCDIIKLQNYLLHSV